MVGVLGKLHGAVKEESLSDSLRNFALALRSLGSKWRTLGSLPEEEVHQIEVIRFCLKKRFLGIIYYKLFVFVWNQEKLGLN